MNVTFEPLIPLGLVALAAVALALADLAPLWRVRSIVSTRRAALISVFSLLGIAVACLPLLSPRIERERTRKSAAIVLVDASKSMETLDAEGGGSRVQAGRKIAKGLAQSVRSARWETHEFGGATSPLGDAIAQARVSAEGPSAIVLVTDGALTGGADPVLAAREARASGVPVFTIRTGSATRTPPPRIASVAVMAPERAPLGGRATVHVSAELEGLAGAPVEVALTLDGKEIGRAPLEASGPRVRRDAAFPVTLDEAGTHRLVATVRSGEHAASASRALRVLAGELRVALIDVPGRWEHRWLRRALEEMPRVHLARVDVFGSEPDARTSAQAIAAIASSDVVILGDIPRRLLAPEVGAALGRAVDEDGAGLLALGGRNAFAGALDLGLAGLLPATAAEDASPVARSFRPQETDAGRALLGELAHRLPTLGSYEPLGVARAGSLVLLECPGRRPLLVLGRWGLGRTGMLATDELWRWAFSADGAGRDAHRELLHETIAWLAARSAGLDEPVTLAPARERIEAGATLATEVEIAATGSAARAVAIRATLADAAGQILSRVEEPRPRDGHAMLAVPVPQAARGELVLRAAALDESGHELGVAERIVTALPGEKEERVGEPANPDLLVQIADAGGGAAFAETDVARGDARRALAATLDPARQVVRETRPLASGASQVLVLALLLSASWGLRRGAGLR